MSTEIWLGTAVVLAGLWSGLLLTVTTILHPIYAARDARGFRQELGWFLPVARRSPTNYILVIVAGHIVIDPEQRECYLADCLGVVEQAVDTAAPPVALDFAINAGAMARELLGDL